MLLPLATSEGTQRFHWNLAENESVLTYHCMILMKPKFYPKGTGLFWVHLHTVQLLTGLPIGLEERWLSSLHRTIHTESACCHTVMLSFLFTAGFGRKFPFRRWISEHRKSHRPPSSDWKDRGNWRLPPSILSVRTPFFFFLYHSLCTKPYSLMCLKEELGICRRQSC